VAAAGGTGRYRLWTIMPWITARPGRCSGRTHAVRPPAAPV